MVQFLTILKQLLNLIPVRTILWPQASCTGCDPAAIWNIDPWPHINMMKLSNLLFLFSWENLTSAWPKNSDEAYSPLYPLNQSAHHCNRPQSKDTNLSLVCQNVLTLMTLLFILTFVLALNAGLNTYTYTNMYQLRKRKQVCFVEVPFYLFSEIQYLWKHHF